MNLQFKKPYIIGVIESQETIKYIKNQYDFEDSLLSAFEIRLDLISDDYLISELIPIIKSHFLDIIITCRENQSNVISRWERLNKFLPFCDYIDIEIDTHLKTSLLEKASQQSKKVILSYHHFYHTPSLHDLEEIFRLAREENPHILKVAVTAQTFWEAGSFINWSHQRGLEFPVVGMLMGEYGPLSRVLALSSQTPWVYCSLSSTPCVAGQISLQEMMQFIQKNTL